MQWWHSAAFPFKEYSQVLSKTSATLDVLRHFFPQKYPLLLWRNPQPCNRRKQQFSLSHSGGTGDWSHRLFLVGKHSKQSHSFYPLPWLLIAAKSSAWASRGAVPHGFYGSYFSLFGDWLWYSHPRILVLYQLWKKINRVFFTLILKCLDSNYMAVCTLHSISECIGSDFPSLCRVLEIFFSSFDRGSHVAQTTNSQCRWSQSWLQIFLFREFCIVLDIPGWPEIHYIAQADLELEAGVAA